MTNEMNPAADSVMVVEDDGVVHVDVERLPIVPVGETLIEHEVYIDVLQRGHGPFRALTGQTAGSGNGYVPELAVDAAIWDMLMREDGEAQLVLEEELAALPQIDLPETVSPGGFR